MTDWIEQAAREAGGEPPRQESMYTVLAWRMQPEALARFACAVLERAAQEADKAAAELDCEWNRRLGVASDLADACKDTAAAIRALKPHRIPSPEGNR